MLVFERAVKREGEESQSDEELGSLEVGVVIGTERIRRVASLVLDGRTIGCGEDDRVPACRGGAAEGLLRAILREAALALRNMRIGMLTAKDVPMSWQR